MNWGKYWRSNRYKEHIRIVTIDPVAGDGTCPVPGVHVKINVPGRGGLKEIVRTGQSVKFPKVDTGFDNSL